MEHGMKEWFMVDHRTIGGKFILDFFKRKENRFFNRLKISKRLRFYTLSCMFNEQFFYISKTANEYIISIVIDP